MERLPSMSFGLENMATSKSTKEPVQQKPKKEQQHRATHQLIPLQWYKIRCTHRIPMIKNMKGRRKKMCIAWWPKDLREQAVMSPDATTLRYSGKVQMNPSLCKSDEILHQIAVLLSDERHEVKYRTSRFHKVLPKPEGLLQTGSLVLIQEPIADIKPGQIIMVLDYVILQTETGPTGRDGWRETKYIRAHSTRREWLWEIGMSQFCPDAHDRCLISMAGRAWKAQDDSKWSHVDGAYGRIVAPQPSQRIPFSHFWHCTQQGMTTGNAWLQWQIQADRELHQEDTSILQTSARWMPSTTQTAQEKLQPPGNGIKFCPHVEVYDDDGMHLEYDRSINNPFIEGFTCTRDGTEETRTKEIFHNIRFERSENREQRKGKLSDASKSDTSGDDQTIDDMENNAKHKEGTKSKQTSNILLPLLDEEELPQNNDSNWHQENTAPIQGYNQQMHRILDSSFEKLKDDVKAKYPLANNWHIISEMHPNTIAALDIARQEPHTGRISRLHIYLDGSCKKIGAQHMAAWAMVVIAETTQGQKCSYWPVGYANGPLVTTPISDFFLGANDVNALEAEISAMQWALIWPLAWEGHEIPPVVIHGDNLMTIEATLAHWRIPTKNSQELHTPKLCRYLLQRLRQSKKDITMKHQKGHIGMPWNELADAIAKDTIHNWRKYDDRRTRLAREIMLNPMAPHAWWNCGQGKMLPPAWSSHIFEPPNAYEGIPRTYQPEHDDKKEKCKVTCINMATINVFSSLDKKAHFANRRAATAAQCHQENLHLVGIQEARTTKDMCKYNPSYIMLTSKANRRGQYGTELWISRSMQIAGETIKEQQLRVIHSEPTMMTIVIDHPSWNCDVIVGHAPQAKDPQADEWWKRLKDQVTERKKKGRQCLILADCNAKTGMEPDECFGSAYRQKECENGRRMREVLTNTGLQAVNTYDTIHKGQAATYAMNRIDYIIADRQLAKCFTATWVNDTIDLLHSKQDHRPLFGNICFAALPGKAQRNKMTYDKKEAHKETSKEVIKEIFQSFVDPGWEVSIEEHVERLTTHVQQGLKSAFPPSAQHPEKPFVGQNTWSLIQERNNLRKSIKNCKEQLKRLTLRECLKAWKGNMQREVEKESTSYNFLMKYQAILEEMKEDTNKQIRKSSKADQIHYLDQIEEELKTACPSGNAKLIYEKLKCFRPANPKKRIKTAKPLPFLIGDAGPVETLEEWCKAWESHWSKLEIAEICPFETHQMAMCDTHPTLNCTKEEIIKEWPTLLQCETAIRRLKRNKAGGRDGITPEIYLAAPEQAAQKIFPLLAKQAAHGTVPFSHRGGLAIPLFKHKGQQHQRENFRSIVLEDVMAKIIAKTWRTRVEQAFQQAACSLQGGARKGLGPNAHILRVRIQQTNARIRKKTFVMLTMDIESAFYRAIRQLIVDVPQEEAQLDFLTRAFRLFQLDPNQVDTFNEELSTTKILDEIGVSRPIQRIIQSSFHGSWCKLPQSEDCLNTSAGSKPGSPMADILFSMIMWKFLKGMREQLANEAQWKEEGNILTWIDDVACTFEAEVEETLPKTAAMLQMMHDQATRLALRPSLKKGKTEAMMCLRGKNSREHRRIKEDSDNIIHFHTREGPKQVACVDESRYLGSIIDCTDSLLPEILATTAQAYSAIRPLKGRVLQQQAFKQTQRKSIIQALALSKTMYSCRTWPKMREAEEKQWNTRIHRIQRSMQKLAEEQHVSDLQMRANNDWPHPRQYLQYARLQLLASLKTWADSEYMQPFFEQEELDGPNTWVSQVVNDMKEVWLEVSDGDSFKAIWERIQSEKVNKDMKKYINRHKKKWKHIQQTMAEIKRSKKDQTATNATKEIGDEWFCYECGIQWNTRTAWAVHNRTAHGILSLAAFYAPTETCYICGRCFHTRGRPIQHLSFGTTTCLERLQKTVEPLTKAQVCWLNERDADARREQNQTGRRTHEQKRIFLEKELRHIEEMTGDWKAYHEDLADWERQEQRELDDWATDCFIDDFLQIADNDDVVRCIGIFADKARRVKSPRNVLWWLEIMQQDLVTLLNGSDLLEFAMLTMADVRRELLSGL